MGKFFAVLLLSLLAQAFAVGQNNTPLEVKVGVYVIGISKISTQTSSYAMDFYLTLDCNRACEKDKDFKFEIINGRIVSSRMTSDQPTYKEYRLNAELVSGFDFKPYPFDKPQLTLIIEDEITDNTKLIYRADPERTAIDAQIPDFGWNVKGMTETVGEHFYPNFKQTFSSYKFAITLARPFWASLLKLLPAVAMMVACLISFVMTIAMTDRRIMLISSALIGSVLFHINLASGVPQVPYLTFADRFMLVNYLVIAISLAISGLLIVWSEKKNEKAQKLHRVTQTAVPVSWVLLQALNILL